jgi:glutaminyl-peptide cyclotransferase
MFLRTMKRTYSQIALFLIILLFPLLFSGPLSNGSQANLNISIYSSQGDELQFNSSKAYNHIVTQLNFGFRVPGTSAHEECADWINQTLQNITDEVVVHEFIVQKPGQPAYNCQNILGKLNTNESNIVILGAHWDSRAVAEKDYYNRTDPIPGANDGGSGVAIILELARILNQSKADLEAQVWFLLLDAEDQGSSRGIYGLEGWRWCEGSIAFNAALNTFYNPNNQSINCFILLDMVGGTDLKFVDEAHSTNSLQEAIFSEARSLGYTTQFPNNPKSMVITDDHIYFMRNSIPSADLIIDFSNGPWTHHHKHSDNIANIDIESLNITGRTVESFVKTYYTGPDLPDWGKASANDMWKQWLLPILLIICIGVVFILLLRHRTKSIS